MDDDLDLRLIGDVYAFVTELGPFSSRDIIDKFSSVDVAQTERAIETLTSLGFFRESQTQPGCIRAYPDGIAVSAALSSLLDRTQRDLSRIADVAASVNIDLKEPRDLGLSFFEIEGIDSILAYLAIVTSSAKDTINSLLPAIPSEYELDEATRDDSPIMKRGVRIRSIYPRLTKYPHYLVSYSILASSRGSEVRAASFSPVRFIIVDDSIALIASSTIDGAPSALVTSNETITSILNCMFDHIWETAVPLKNAQDVEALDARTLGIVRRMAQGYTDTAIAREFDMSRRTFARIVSDLYRETGSYNRFALGIAAMQKGWLA